MHPHLCTDHHQRIAGIVARVPQISQTDARKPAKMFADGEQVGKHLGRVKLIGQSVPHRHARVPCDLLHDILPESPIFDSLKHTSQHPRRVRDALFLANLRSYRIQVSSSHAQIVSRYLKGAAGPGTRLLKNQGNILSPQHIHRYPLLFLIFQIRRHIHQIENLLRRKIEQLQKMPSFQIHDPVSFPIGKIIKQGGSTNRPVAYFRPFFLYAALTSLHNIRYSISESPSPMLPVCRSLKRLQALNL